MEFKCKELLHMNHQLDTTIDQTAKVSVRVPPPLFAAFIDFILFLLSTHLAVWEDRVNEESIKMIKDKVHRGLHQSQSILLRMNEHLEMDLDQIGYESIRTADSILGLQRQLTAQSKKQVLESTKTFVCCAKKSTRSVLFSNTSSRYSRGCSALGRVLSRIWISASSTALIPISTR
jgi:hypothetical protein